MSEQLVVHHLDGDRFAIDVRGHRLLVDQPVGAGGTDTAPTPTELFVAGLAGRVGFYARRYLARYGIDATGLTVSASYEIGGRPNRVQAITIVITSQAGLPPDRRAAFLAVASHCTVHNTLTEPAEVSIALAAAVEALNRPTTVCTMPTTVCEQPNEETWHEKTLVPPER